MGKIEEAKAILKELGLPPAQQNEISACTLLALAGIKKNGKWSQAKRQSLHVTKGIMKFVNSNYGKTYAPNTRETFRRQVLHQFYQAGIAEYNPDDNTLPTNSPNAHYALAERVAAVLREYGTAKWTRAVKKLRQENGALTDRYDRKRELQRIPITLPNGKKLHLSPGSHSMVQAAILKEFAPRFAGGAQVLYLGDTAKKNLVMEKGRLEELGIIINEHDKLPDVILFNPNKGWLFLIEAVTSHGPMNPKRVMELEKIFGKSKLGKVYVTAFPGRAEFRRHEYDIAWETEVWISSEPDHMIHYNGDKFFGPRK